MKDVAVYITDEIENFAMVIIAVVTQSNGVIHLVDYVLLPIS